MEETSKRIILYDVGERSKIYDWWSRNRIIDIVKSYVKLTPYYIITRYPDVEGPITKKNADSLLQESKKVTHWVKQVLKQ